MLASIRLSLRAIYVSISAKPLSNLPTSTLCIAACRLRHIIYEVKNHGSAYSTAGERYFASWSYHASLFVRLSSSILCAKWLMLCDLIGKAFLARKSRSRDGLSLCDLCKETYCFYIRSHTPGGKNFRVDTAFLRILDLNPFALVMRTLFPNNLQEKSA